MPSPRRLTPWAILYRPSGPETCHVSCASRARHRGRSPGEARAMAEDAIRPYLESLHKDGLPIPADKKLALDPIKEEIKVAVV